MSALPESVVITDDSMREGLQIESADISVDAKLRLLDALGDTGAKVISIGSSIPSVNTTLVKRLSSGLIDASSDFLQEKKEIRRTIPKRDWILLGHFKLFIMGY